ncbi:MAG: hypothetical protein KAX49_00895 [Halanaerobiales bacterium]|nr:hypothetical protein [Halanaerobiales bacterium]
MKYRIFLLIIIILLINPLIAKAELSIYDALELGEKLELFDFVAAIKMDERWVLKAYNLDNLEESELHINSETGIVEYSMNITPKDIVIGENTYGYAGNIYQYSENFYLTDLCYNCLKIYRHNSKYFKMKNAIFIHNLEGFVAYYMYTGPGVTK